MSCLDTGSIPVTSTNRKALDAKAFSFYSQEY
jgi:hypothetical protein